ncbi:hypothetical protein Bpfe_008426 [Biomphalaria pfeifferi]|uniref:THAP-type domain-containing protein n=1 Tax=Biomphalaria pfeifferi TaxID=112525 RepID=A0AAD8BYT3_BIOPF|nr:hypothetical protein Bpfe_008426 [Biomphalaria pfeifferi]
MPGGSSCAVIGCYTQRFKCRGLSFHKLPKKSTNKAWLNALITAIDRVDSRFNPDTARICSRHFTESCFVPTDSSKCTTYKITPKQLPSKLIVQLPPDPPPLPECVKYRHFSELKKDVCNPECLPSPWCLLEANDNHALLGMMNDMKTSVKLKLNISEELIVSASIMENPIPDFIESIEKVTAYNYLKLFLFRKFCPGIVDGNLQPYANPKNSEDQIYYKEFNIGSQETVVRATKCEILMKQTSSGLICKYCSYAKRLLNRKLLRAKSRYNKPLSKHDPLHKTTREKLISELKNARKESSECQKKNENSSFN